jgi:Zn-dependent protease with chaperone function
MADKSENQFSKFAFMRSVFLPMLLIFLVPGVSFWFFNHVENNYDEMIFESIESEINSEAELSAEEKTEIIEGYRQVPVSKIMASWNPELKPLQDNFSELSFRYLTFRWMKRISMLCLISSVLVLLFAGVSVVLSLKSQAFQYYSLSLSWVVLKLFSVLQVICQGILVVELSFWMTAFWGEVYYIKLIALAGLLVLAACALLIAAIFTVLPKYREVEGVVTNESQATGLWGRIDELSQRIQCSRPDQIIFGIDDNFYVTEFPLKVNGQLYKGRTLFLSLSMLKVLSKSEADAVIAHELGHFSGQDTLYSKKISPLMRRYNAYLKALYEGGVSRPIFYFMAFFWSLYQISLSRLSRQREFRADMIAAEQTSPQDFAHSLVKVSAYSQYRNQVENEIFKEEKVLESVGLLGRITEGFGHFLGRQVKVEELEGNGIVHPFDSHPPLSHRLEALNHQLPQVLGRASVDIDAGSWFHEIESAEELEKAQWDEYEENFRAFHEESLAYRLLPTNDEARAIIEKLFPPEMLPGKKGDTFSVDIDKVHYSQWEGPIRFEEIVKCDTDEHKTVLTIHYIREPDTKKKKEKVKFKGVDGAPYEVFASYFSRYSTAKEIQDTKRAERQDPISEMS